MKTYITLLALSIALTDSKGFASGSHNGDTVFPGSPEWIHAGSPRDSQTGDSILLIRGADGTLHRVGFEIETADGPWVPLTLQNLETVNEQKALAPLREAVQQIARDMPDKLLPFGMSTRVRRPAATAFDPYKEMIDWADSIALCYGDPAFPQRIKRYYRSPKNLNPYWTPFYIYREKS